MRLGRWRKLLSYLFELPVEKRQSRYSGEVAVTLHRGQYKLSSANAVYSFGKQYTSFSIPFRALQTDHLSMAKVLVLGFGLGSVVDLLENNSNIRQIIAVDADEVILELAGKYLNSSLKDAVSYVCTEAAPFIRDCRETYDLVLFDVFIDDKTPVPLMQEEFLGQLKQSLAPGGLLLYSKLDLDRADKTENAQFDRVFSKVFPGAFSIPAEGNRVFCFRN